MLTDVVTQPPEKWVAAHDGPHKVKRWGKEGMFALHSQKYEVLTHCLDLTKTQVTFLESEKYFCKQ